MPVAGPTIVFDLDGTLIDTAPDLLDSLNHCLTLAGLATAEPAKLRQYVGFGGRVMIARAAAAQNAHLGEPDLDRLLEAFLEHYSSSIPGKSRPYPGAVAAIERFQAAGYLAAICTNKFERLSAALVGGLGMADRFAAICGADTFAFRKPDPRHLTETIARAGGDPNRAIMIGDSRTDIDTARAAGVPVIAVDWGYTDRHVAEFDPSLVISHFDELDVALANRLIAAANGVC
jgi:phosphoglycolate phosphatase